MNNFEFLSYEPVVGEKFLGIATVRAWGKIILRYKIVPGKDGGWFAGAASIKNGDKYESAFMIDSQYESKALMEFIKTQVAEVMDAPKVASKPVIEEECPF